MGRRTLLRRAPFLLLLGAACAAEGGDPTEPESHGDIPTGSTAGRDDRCDTWMIDRTEQNLVEVNRLGLLLSRSIVEGRIGGAFELEDGYRATIHVDRVYFGPHFLQDVSISFIVDASEVANLQFPGRFIVGFDGNGFPTRDSQTGASWWQKRVVIPSTARNAYADLLTYRADLPPWVAIVQIVDQDPNQTRFRVVQPLLGSFPEEYSSNWDMDAFAAPFPGVSSELFIASLSDLYYFENPSQHVGTALDFRPATPDALAEVDRALETAAPTFNRQRLLESARLYKDGWRFFRSPDIVATTVTGLAGECCSGLGGTYVAGEIHRHLKGGEGVKRFVRGGHGYFTEASCGDMQIVGMRGLGDQSYATAEQFSCDGPWGASLADSPVPDIKIEMPDSDDNRSLVDRWITSAPPMYRLHPAWTAIDAVQPYPSAVWSQPLSVIEALVARSHLALIEVVDVSNLDGGYAMTIETTFHPASYGHLERYKAKLAFECGDERLLREGSQWLVPIVNDRANQEFERTIDGRSAFIVPGVVLPPMEYIERITATLDFVLRQ